MPLHGRPDDVYGRDAECVIAHVHLKCGAQKPTVVLPLDRVRGLVDVGLYLQNIAKVKVGLRVACSKAPVDRESTRGCDRIIFIDTNDVTKTQANGRLRVRIVTEVYSW